MSSVGSLSKSGGRNGRERRGTVREEGPYIGGSDLSSISTRINQRTSSSHELLFSIGPYLGGDQGRKTSAGDVTHFV